MTITQIYVEKNRRKGNKLSVVCPEHGRIAQRYVADEAITIATEHEISHRSPNQ